jgi:hypothetical protein
MRKNVRHVTQKPVQEVIVVQDVRYISVLGAANVYARMMKFIVIIQIAPTKEFLYVVNVNTTLSGKKELR